MVIYLQFWLILEIILGWISKVADINLSLSQIQHREQIDDIGRQNKDLIVQTMVTVPHYWTTSIIKNTNGNDEKTYKSQTSYNFSEKH